MVQECRNRPNSMSVDEWCRANNITKANNLKPYNYFKYLLEEIPRHMDEHGMDFCEDLLPWSDTLPVECRKQLE